MPSNDQNLQRVFQQALSTQDIAPTIGRMFRNGWKSLILADVLFKVIAYVVLIPLTGLLFHLFLAYSGRTILVDTDIARFLIHPIGWLTFVVVAGALVGILALEQSVLIMIALSRQPQKIVRPVAAIRHVARCVVPILALAGRAVAFLGLTAAPFLAVGAGLYWLLLTAHDINFYLKHRPPVFWVAVTLIGVVLSVLLAVVLRLIVGWSLALPLLLFEKTPARACLAVSSARTRGHRKRIALWICGWVCLAVLMPTILVVPVVWLARIALPHAADSVWMLSSMLGIVLLLWLTANLLSTVVSNILLSLILAGLYKQCAQGTAGEDSEMVDLWTGSSVRLSRGWIVSSCCITVVLATLVGAVAIHGVRLQDRVQITAHRGGAAKSPENTLAAIRQAIDDGADWVEIDVQETKDGKVVVAHDSDLMRAAGSDLKIWETNSVALRSIDIGSYFDGRFKDERVPTLSEVLQTCKGKVKVNIELKYYGHDQQLEQRVVSLVEDHEMQSQIVIMSLSAEGIRKIKQLKPQWTTGLLIAVAAGDPTRADADFVAVNTELATREWIESAHARQKEVYVWTVNDPATMSAMIGRGVDNIITDDPALARRVLAERAVMSPVERVVVELAIFLGTTH